MRCHALVHLRKLLVEQQAVFYGLVMAGETVDPLIAKIIAAVCEHELRGTSAIMCICVFHSFLLQLLQGCRTASTDERVLFGECLGDLGAIDPGRLPPLTLAPGDRKRKFIGNVTDLEFRRELMVCLCQAYARGEDRKTQVSSCRRLEAVSCKPQVLVLGQHRFRNPRTHQSVPSFAEQTLAVGRRTTVSEFR